MGKMGTGYMNLYQSMPARSSRLLVICRPAPNAAQQEVLLGLLRPAVPSEVGLGEFGELAHRRTTCAWKAVSRMAVDVQRSELRECAGVLP